MAVRQKRIFGKVSVAFTYLWWYNIAMDNGLRARRAGAAPGPADLILQRGGFPTLFPYKYTGPGRESEVLI